MKELGVTDHRFLGGFGSLPRLRHEVARGRPRGRRRRRPRERLLARRPHRGRRPPGRGHPRGPPAGAGHLRRVRRLRPPRPHPGAPGGDVRRRSWPPCRPTAATSASRGTSPRSTGARCRRAGCGRACARCATPATPRSFEGMDPDGPLPPFVTADEDLAAVVDAPDYVDAEDGRAARPRHPDHRRRAVLRAVQQRRRRRSGASSSTGSPRARRASSARTASRPTCSPASEPVDACRRRCAAAWPCSALRRRRGRPALGDGRRAPALAGGCCWRWRRPLATVLALPPGWWARLAFVRRAGSAVRGLRRGPAARGRLPGRRPTSRGYAAARGRASRCSSSAVATLPPSRPARPGRRTRPRCLGCARDARRAATPAREGGRPGRRS